MKGGPCLAQVHWSPVKFGFFHIAIPYFTAKKNGPFA
jgi:hypothetical protein